MSDTPATESNQQPNAPAQRADVKTYTESELNAIVADRLARNEKSLRKRLTDELKAEIKSQLEEERKAAELPEIERLKAELEKATAERDGLAAELRGTQDELVLTGKVTNPRLALKALEDKHRTKDGVIDLEALFADYPDLQPRAEDNPPSAPAYPYSGPGVRKPTPFAVDEGKAYEQKKTDPKYRV